VSFRFLPNFLLQALAVCPLTFQIAMEATKVVSEENIDAFKDVYNAIAAAGVAITKDSIQSDSSEGDSSTDLRALRLQLQA